MANETTDYRNFNLTQAWPRRVDISSPVLKGDMDQAYFFEVLLKKREGIKGIYIDADKGIAVIDFDPERLSKSGLLNIVDIILGNLLTKQTLSSSIKQAAPASDRIREIRLKVEGMSCPACAALIKVSLKKLAGVDDALADLETKEVIIYGALDESLAIKKIEALGYKHIKTHD